MVEEEKAGFVVQIDAAEEWIYSDEGFDAVKSKYEEKLQSLKDLGLRVTGRMEEAERRPGAITDLRAALAKLLKLTAEPSADADTDGGGAASAGGAADRSLSQKQHDALDRWLEKTLEAQSALPQTVDPVLTVQELRAKAALAEEVQVRAAALRGLRDALAKGERVGGGGGGEHARLNDEDRAALTKEAEAKGKWLADKLAGEVAKADEAGAEVALTVTAHAVKEQAEALNMTLRKVGDCTATH